MKVKSIIGMLLVSLVAVAGNPESYENYLVRQKKISINRLYQNISRSDTVPGVVVASPSKSNPNYYFHWVRDAALVMDLVGWQLSVSDSTKESEALLQKMFTWADLVKRFQNTPNMSGGFGEPKFNVDGTAYNHPWGRPQNDGPALRALALIRFADYLLNNNYRDYVLHNLYTKKLPAQGLIKRDLEYVAQNIEGTDFDPWEEVRGFHFYNRMAQCKALYSGAELAEKLGDHGAADYYKERAAQLEHKIQQHWDGKRKIFVATLGRDGGADYKFSGIDSSVMLAINHVGEDTFLALEDDRVISTAHVLRKTFQEVFSINRNGLPGTLIGRYPEDKYDGTGFSEGHGWVLATHGLAEYYYRLAKKLQKNDSINITDLNLEFFQDKFVESNISKTSLYEGRYNKKSQTYNKLITSLIVSADNLMKRVEFHTPGDGSFYEQINRYSGFMQGAPDLTWSYASFLTALRARDQVL